MLLQLQNSCSIFFIFSYKCRAWDFFGPYNSTNEYDRTTILAKKLLTPRAQKEAYHKFAQIYQGFLPNFASPLLSSNHPRNDNHHPRPSETISAASLFLAASLPDSTEFMQTRQFENRSSRESLQIVASRATVNPLPKVSITCLILITCSNGVT